MYQTIIELKSLVIPLMSADACFDESSFCDVFWFLGK